MKQEQGYIEAQDENKEEYSKMDSLLYVIGIIMILMGAYATLSILSYFFNWEADYSLINPVDGEKNNPLFDPSAFNNRCGGLGARISEALVGRSFGVAGIFIPLYIAYMGWNFMKKVRVRAIFNQNTLIVAIVTILTSLTFGSVFGESNIFHSGLGGEFGVEISRQLLALLDIGQFLLLIGAWIATGVFINRNFINVMNRAGSSAKSGGNKIASMLKKNKKGEVIGQEFEMQKPTDREDELEDNPYSEAPEQVAIEEDIQFIENSINDTYSSTLDNSLEVVDDECIIDDVMLNIEPADDQEDDDNPFIEVILESKRNAERAEPASIEESSDEGAEAVASQGAVVYVEANDVKVLDENEIEQSSYDPTKDIYSYVKPHPSLLEDYQAGNVEIDKDEIFYNKTQIEETLSHFGIPIQQIKATVGPTITLYEIVQAHGVKISKIQGLENDIAQSLKALGIRIIAPIPGKGTIGIEVPNRNKQIVSMRSAILSPKFQEMKAELPIVIGRTIQNDNYVFDLAKMPHLLVAGATGQGKSVGLNAIITSLLYRKHPSELKFVMIDPKMVEFSPYRHLEHHFMAKMASEEDVIITDPKKAVYTLNAICEEMDKRLKLLSEAESRNIIEYNDKFKRRTLNPNKGHFYMPYIVVIIDEFADLIMIAREVESPVMRIAQKARAAGIHLIVATQRPDVKVITGGIKANFPARIAFRVTQMIDSRTIIDQPGANQLIGRGDMLFSKDGDLTRIQCALVETNEVTRIVDHISAQQGYPEAYQLPDYTPEGSGDLDMGSESGAVIKYDSLFADIARAAVSNGGISTSAIQRNYEVGFNRAGRIMTQMERAGIVGRQEGAKPRDILFHDMPSLEAKLQELGLF